MKLSKNSELIKVVFVGSILLLLFFGRLFFPEPKIIFTPDYGGSDVLQQYYPVKDFLSNSLKEGRLPFWSKDIGTGYPVFAEGQSGALNLSNLILFGLLPTWLAWNLSYVLYFFLSFLGSYLFLKRIGTTSLASFFSAVVFSFGGFFVVHMSHFDLLQASALLPWLFLFADGLLEKYSNKKFFLFSFVLAQQVFTGHLQMVAISLIGIFSYILVKSSGKKTDMDGLVKKLGMFSLAVIFSMSLAAMQLLPSWEYFQLSPRSGGLSSSQIFQFPFKPINLVGFLFPNFKGTPKDGSFPSPFETDSGIYWENTGYLGILPVLLVFLLPFIDKKKKKEKKIRDQHFLALMILSLLLVLGESSPLSFLFSFPGLNAFRVPSRFLLLTTFFLSVLSASGFESVYSWFKKRIRSKSYKYVLSSVVLIVAVGDLFYFGFNYHPFVSVKEALQKPTTASIIGNEDRFHAHDIQKNIWNDYFLSKGWNDVRPYVYFKNGMPANLNLVFDRSSVNLHSSYPTTRIRLQQQMLPLLFDSTAVKYIISPKILETDPFEYVSTVDSPFSDIPSYQVYRYKKGADRFRFAFDNIVAKSPEELEAILDREDFSFEESVILEVDLEETFEELQLAEIEVIVDENSHLRLETETDKKAILVVADSYYPAWKAKINGEELKIFPANINQRAVIVPKGKNVVEMKYSPEQFHRGVAVSVTTLILFIFIVKIKPSRFVKPLISRK